MIKVFNYTDRDLQPMLGRTVAVKTLDGRHSRPVTGRLSLKACGDSRSICYVVGSQMFCPDVVLSVQNSQVLPIVVLP